jgi:hypothetical protein
MCVELVEHEVINSMLCGDLDGPEFDGMGITCPDPNPVLCVVSTRVFVVCGVCCEAGSLQELVSYVMFC